MFFSLLKMSSDVYEQNREARPVVGTNAQRYSALFDTSGLNFWKTVSPNVSRGDRMFGPASHSEAISSFFSTTSRGELSC